MTKKHFSVRPEIQRQLAPCSQSQGATEHPDVWQLIHCCRVCLLCCRVLAAVPGLILAPSLSCNSQIGLQTWASITWGRKWTLFENQMSQCVSKKKVHALCPPHKSHCSSTDTALNLQPWPSFHPPPVLFQHTAHFSMGPLRVWIGVGSKRASVSSHPCHCHPSSSLFKNVSDHADSFLVLMRRFPYPWLHTLA